MKRYLLTELGAGQWQLVDTELDITITFDEHQFNETQKLAIGNKLTGQALVTELPKALSAMGDWMAMHHYSVAMPTPVHELRCDEDTGEVSLIRHKSPRFEVRLLDDGVTAWEYGQALAKASAWLKRLYEDRANDKGED